MFLNSGFRVVYYIHDLDFWNLELHVGFSVVVVSFRTLVEEGTCRVTTKPLSIKTCQNQAFKYGFRFSCFRAQGFSCVLDFSSLDTIVSYSLSCHHIPLKCHQVRPHHRSNMQLSLQLERKGCLQ